MKQALLAFAACLLLVAPAPAPALAADDAPPTPKGTTLAPDFSALRFSANGGGEGNLKPLSAADTGGRRPGFRLETTKQPGAHYGVEVRLPLDGSIDAGDVLFSRFAARITDAQRYEAGEGFTLSRVQNTGPPHQRSNYREWTVGPDWEVFYVADRADAAIPEGRVAFVFSGGYPPQTLEIAGVEVVNLGPDADPAEFPVKRKSYAGASADAPWRAAAAERIERHRKADLEVTVLDADGEPVPDAEVRVELVEHAFDFGVAISAKWLDDNAGTPQAARYIEELEKHFNTASIENALKWSRWESEPEVAMTTLRGLNKMGMRVHGHVLVWPGLEKFRVADAEELWAAAQDDPELLRSRVDNHIDDILSRTAGLVDTWDVVNEAFNQNEFLKLLGDEEVAAWFKRARAGAPDATLIYNDFALLGQNGTNAVKQRFVHDLVQDAMAAGAPIDAIGFQSHMGSGLTPPEKVLEILSSYDGLGVGYQVTEFDVVTDDPQLTEAYVRDFMTAAFSKPQMQAFIFWNFHAGSKPWMPDAAVFEEDWSPSPTGRAALSLIHGAWHTDERVAADADGRATVRGFLGRHRVEATLPGGTRITREVDLPAGGTKLRLRADPTP
ncbi:endo-1,4-beta-xylanase [Phycisphaera mikurensis]|uniref:Beta-xylanase n=1 Tax=Phycisphaera mikurensis (strain NBRC 102666 / KCTC 22515 / FYK2301M01) TaxID=1142394 RepID=I0ICW8_PHYMF|nr:endo-1,4-beta-xylanase [Phycisphaera mikurensis]MBB6442236.1 GH35 family endo-1,4-beta-xylanase [Phycisphaera mikurensis]BAM03106.1 putative glycoside hydrolase [Phycisphaera mikurensis NBRC 102666]